MGDPAFHHSLFITLIFVLFVVPAQTVLALVLASVLQSAGAGKTFFRTAFFLPYMTSTVAVTTVFMKLFVAGGPLAGRRRASSGSAMPPGTPSPTSRCPSWSSCTSTCTSVSTSLCFLGGIENVPTELMRRPKVDGAGMLQRFRSVTVPSVRPYVFFVVVAGFIQAVQVFDQAYVIASNGAILGSPAGATATLVIFLYQQAFRVNNLGYGSAAAVVLLVIVSSGTVLTRKLCRSDEEVLACRWPAGC